MADLREYDFVTSVAAENGKLLLFRRKGGVSDVVSLDIKPFVLTDFSDIPEAEEVCKLSGNNLLCCKGIFADLPSFERAAEALKKLPGVKLFKDFVQMAYLDTGIRLFGGMEFSDLRRMQLSVETDEKGEEVLVTIDDDDEFDRVADYFEDELFDTIDYDEGAEEPKQ